MTAERSDNPEVEFWPILAVIGMVGAFALVIGFTYPALSFAMEAAGFSKTTIGLQSAMTGAGIVVASVLTPMLATRTGAWPLGVANGGFTVAILLGFGFLEPGWTWFVLRFALGISICALFVLGETWLNELTPDHIRGRMVSIYTTTVAAMFGLGPLLIPHIGFEGARPFFIVCLLVALMLLPLWTLRNKVSSMHDAEGKALWTIFAVIPVLIAAVGVFGMFDGAIMGLWVVYCLDLGHSEQIASWTLSAAILGNLFLQIPIGWLADRISRRKILVFCAAAGIIGGAALPFLDLSALHTLPLLMLWGGLCFGTYTIALTLIGEHLRGAQLIAANAAFGLMWGMGAIVGGIAAGGLMDLAGPIGLPAFITAIFAGLTVFALSVAPVRGVRIAS